MILFKLIWKLPPNFSANLASFYLEHFLQGFPLLLYFLLLLQDIEPFVFKESFLGHNVQHVIDWVIIIIDKYFVLSISLVQEFPPGL